MLRIALVLIFVLISAAAYAQFNKCGPGFCPGSIFSGSGFSAPAGSITPPVCSNQLDFSQACNSQYLL